MGKQLIRFDWAIKKLLRQKANFQILEGFLSSLLKEEIIIQNIIESESNQSEYNDKYNRVDVAALNSKGEIIIIEVQINGEADFFQRMLYGTSKCITDNMEKGDKYESVKKVYSVNIVYFDLGHGTDYVYHGKTDFIGIHDNDLLDLSVKQKEYFKLKDLYQVFPEYYVIKVNQFNDLAKDSLDEWIYYLKNNKLNEGAKAPGLDLVEKNLYFESLSEVEKSYYLNHLDSLRIEYGVILDAKLEGIEEGKKVGIAQGIEEGKKAGIEEGKRQIALEMIADGESLEKIIKYSKLSEEEICGLRSSV